MMKKLLLQMHLFLFLFLLSSCAEYFSEEEEEGTLPSTNKTIQITTRSSDGTELPYPILIYAFDAEGSCANQQKIDSSEDGNAISLNLPKAKFHIVALAGATEQTYNIPDKPTITDVIEMKNENSADKPLMMGSVDVTLQNSNTKANITMGYAVAQLNVSLSDIPNEYSSVEVELSSFYSQLRFNGEYTEQKSSVKVPCSRNTSGEWKTKTFYTFSSSQNKTIISIHLTKGEITETHGYTYNNRIQINHPFILEGTYSPSSTFEGELIASGWEDPIPVKFTFNQDEQVNDDDNIDNGNEIISDEFTVDDFPEEESIWKDCFVLKVTEDENGKAADVLLMGINNATNTAGKEKMLATDATEAIKNYSVPGLSNWRIPSTEEAKFLKGRYNENLGDINETLLDTGGTGLVLEKTRYLCNNGNSTFDFKSNTISKAGDKTDYYLRPVKTIRMIKE